MCSVARLGCSHTGCFGLHSEDKNRLGRLAKVLSIPVFCKKKEKSVLQQTLQPLLAVFGHFFSFINLVINQSSKLEV